MEQKHKSNLHFNLKRQMFNKTVSAGHLPIYSPCANGVNFPPAFFPLTLILFLETEAIAQPQIWAKVKLKPQCCFSLGAPALDSDIPWFTLSAVESSCVLMWLFSRRSPPPGSLSQLFPRQLLHTSRELLLPPPDTEPPTRPNSLRTHAVLKMELRVVAARTI